MRKGIFTEKTSASIGEIDDEIVFVLEIVFEKSSNWPPSIHLGSQVEMLSENYSGRQTYNYGHRLSFPRKRESRTPWMPARLPDGQAFAGVTDGGAA